MRKRENSFCVRLNDKEMKVLNKKVALSKLPREAFVRKCILGKDIYEAPPVDYFETIRQLRMLGNNINSVLAIARSNHILDVPRFERAVDELYETEVCMRKAFGVK